MVDISTTQGNTTIIVANGKNPADNMVDMMDLAMLEKVSPEHLDRLKRDLAKWSITRQEWSSL